jgi:hypothetical protein
MRHRLYRLLLPALLLAALLAPSRRPVRAQSPGGGYNVSTITTTGQLGNIISYYNNAIAPGNHTIDWSVTGTAPSACTFSFDGSSDLVHWYSLSGVQSCTSSSMFHIVDKPVLYARLYILTYTAGDGTTAVTMHYTRGQ